MKKTFLSGWKLFWEKMNGNWEDYLSLIVYHLINYIEMEQIKPNNTPRAKFGGMSIFWLLNYSNSTKKKTKIQKRTNDNQKIWCKTKLTAKILYTRNPNISPLPTRTYWVPKN